MSGCSSSMMTQTETQVLDSPDQALVTFIRPSMFGGAIQFGIWDGDHFIGVLSAKSYVQYLAEPGEHLFLARAENWSYVKANLEAGKEYFIIGKVFPGVWKARVALDPVANGDGTNQADIDRWLTELKPTTVLPEKYEGYVSPRVAQVKEAAGEVDNGKVKYEVLLKEDGR
jgi:hypothetical protein